MGQSSPINSEWKTGCITQSIISKEPSWCEPERIGTTGTLQIPAFSGLQAYLEQAIKEKTVHWR